MTADDLNALVSQAYDAAFEYESELESVYRRAFRRASRDASSRFSSTVVVAAGFVPPPIDTLTSGLTEKEQQQADRVRDKAAAAIAAALIALGLTAVAASFLQAISARGALNFEQELLRTLRTVVAKGLAEGWTADATALAIQEAFTNVSPTTAQMLAQSELTSLVNERSLTAAQKVAGESSQPMYKRWETRKDPRVRPAHASTQGQTVPIDQPFHVAEALMMYPGDPQGPMRYVARCRCTMSYTHSLTASAQEGQMAARPDVSELAMVAVYPTAQEAKNIATAGGNPADTMHVTMVFLGEVANIDMEAAARAVEKVALASPALSGKVGGIGMFAGGPDGFPQLAIPNVSGLSTLRTRLTDALAAEGVESPSEHDWVPHMTLAYVEEPSLPDDLSVIGKPLTFDTLSLTVADVRTDFPFAASVVASALEDTIVNMQTDSNSATSATDTTIFIPVSDNTMVPTVTTAGLTITIEETEDDVSEVEDTTEDAVEDDAEDAVEEMPMEAEWTALLAIEGQPTEDGRLIDPGALSWRDLPLSLMAMDTTGPGGHEGAQVAGRIDRIWRDGSDIFGSGVFDTGEFGCKVKRMVAEQTLRGNSVDLAVTAFEYRNENGDVLDMDGVMEAMMNDELVVMAVTEGVILASTVCPTPAIAGAEILIASGVVRMEMFFAPPEETLTASAAGMAPLHPPAAWFDDPKLDRPTPLTVTKEGRVYGHAALWNSCHIGEPSGPGVCVPPPRSGMNYEIFHHGACETAEGFDVPCGQITMSTLHASRDMGWKATLEHYEHSGCAVADVQAHEDRYGIVVAGALRPELPAAKVRELKAGSLSGDWRQVIGRGLEFLAALVVNIPGFPIPRPEARIVASAVGEEEVLALVAAGMVTVEDEQQMSRREYLRRIGVLTSE